MTNKKTGKTWYRDYHDWNLRKQKLENQHEIPEFSERDVWYASVGTNIGNEIDGKNKYYERPVVVLRKYDKNLFFGVPLTSRRYTNNWYHKLRNGSYAVLIQCRIFSSKRLQRRKGRLTSGEFNQLRLRLLDII
jgi:mRNA interferase MazF